MIPFAGVVEIDFKASFGPPEARAMLEAHGPMMTFVSLRIAHDLMHTQQAHAMRWRTCWWRPWRRRRLREETRAFCMEIGRRVAVCSDVYGALAAEQGE